MRRLCLSSLLASSASALIVVVPLSTVACGGSVGGDPGAAPAEVGVDVDSAVSLDDADVGAPPDDTAVVPDTAPPASCGDASTPTIDAAPTTCLIKPPPPPPPPSDAGSDAASDAPIDDTGPTGAISSVYPAFPLDAPQLQNHGGRILDHPQMVSVTWSDDPEAAKLDDFTDKVGASSYWNSVTCEYGIGPANNGACSHVHLTEALPAKFSETDADAFVVKNASDWMAAGWPQPSKQIVYVLYLPPTVDLMMNSRGGTPRSACKTGVGGYHTAARLKDGSRVAYAVIPRCTFGSLSAFDETTSAASHELAEAATDAVPQGNAAYNGFDDAHIAWTAFQLLQVENGDICEFYADSFYKNTDLGYQVQRTWSNASIAGGHAPCVPTDGKVYFNVTPLGLSPVSFRSPGGGGGTLSAPGVNIKVGDTGSFQVGYYSDGPMDADWDLKAAEGNGIPGTSLTGGPGAAFANGNLDITVDNPHGRNGNKATITVKLRGKDPQLGANLVTMISTSSSRPGIKHYWPVLVTSN